MKGRRWRPAVDLSWLVWTDSTARGSGGRRVGCGGGGAVGPHEKLKPPQRQHVGDRAAAAAVLALAAAAANVVIGAGEEASQRHAVDLRDLEPLLDARRGGGEGGGVGGERRAEGRLRRTQKQRVQSGKAHLKRGMRGVRSGVP